MRLYKAGDVDQALWRGESMLLRFSVPSVDEMLS